MNDGPQPAAENPGRGAGEVDVSLRDELERRQALITEAQRDFVARQRSAGVASSVAEICADGMNTGVLPKIVSGWQQDDGELLLLSGNVTADDLADESGTGEKLKVSDELERHLKDLTPDGYTLWPRSKYPVQDLQVMSTGPLFDGDKVVTAPDTVALIDAFIPDGLRQATPQVSPNGSA